MKDYIAKRTLDVAIYMVETNGTVRGAAKKIRGFKIDGTYIPKYLCRLIWYFPMHR